MEEDRPPARAPGAGPWEGSTRELASALRDLVSRLRAEQDQRVPRGRSFLDSPSSLNGGSSRSCSASRGPPRDVTTGCRPTSRPSRPISRRGWRRPRRRRGRHVATTSGWSWRSARSRRRGSRQRQRGLDGDPRRYYWAFEQRMRGSRRVVEDRLRGYEDLVVPLREAFASTERAIAPAGSTSDAVRGSSAPSFGNGDGTRRASTAHRRRRGVPRPRDRRDARRRPRLPRDATRRPGRRGQRDPADRAPPEARMGPSVRGDPSRARPGRCAPARDDQRPEPRCDRRLLRRGCHPHVAGASGNAAASWPSTRASQRVEVRFLHEDHRGRAQDVAIWAVKAAG